MKNKDSLFHKGYLTLLILIVVLPVAVLTVQKKIDRAMYSEYYALELVDIKAEYIGNSYNQYQAEDGYELYKITQKIKNNSSFNCYSYYDGALNASDVTEVVNPYLTEYTVESYMKNSAREVDYIIPAGLEGTKVSIVKVAEETTELLYTTYNKDGNKKITVPLEK